MCKNFVSQTKPDGYRLLRSLALGTFLILLTTSATSAADSPRDPSTGLAFSMGTFDVLENGSYGETGVEYRFSKFKWRRLDLNPVVGFTVATEGNFWGYGGLRWDVPSRSDRIVTTLGFGLALYEQGDGKNLGGEVEFRSSLDVAYQLQNGTRVGVSLYHLSNGRLYSFNSGSESLVLTWSFGRPR